MERDAIVDKILSDLTTEIELICREVEKPRSGVKGFIHGLRVEVCYCYYLDGDDWYRAVIDEAMPDNYKLCEYIRTRVTVVDNTKLAIATEW